LEDIDLNKLGALKLFIPDTDTEGNLVATPTNQGAQKTTEQPQNNQTQQEPNTIESANANKKTNPAQNNSSSESAKNEPKEEQTKENEKVKEENSPSINISEQKRSMVADTVQEIIKIADRNNEVGQQIKVIAQTQNQNQEKLETGMQIIQSRSGFAKFFIGPNYGEINNANKLLEQNREQIKQLDEVKSKLVSQNDQQELIEQVQLLEQANQKIESSLSASQKGFSLLGWVFRRFGN